MEDTHEKLAPDSEYKLLEKGIHKYGNTHFVSQEGPTDTRPLHDKINHFASGEPVGEVQIFPGNGLGFI